MATVFSVLAQGAEEGDANEHFKFNNYFSALPLYKRLVSQQPENIEFQYRLGVCMMELKSNPAEAVKVFEKLCKSENAPKDAFFLLARCYHLLHQWDKAMEQYVVYKNLVVKDKEEYEKAEHHIEMCVNGKQISQNKVNVKFTNLGNEVNSENPEYFPWVTADEQTLFFTSRRKGGHASQREYDGFYPSDAFMCVANHETGKWEKVKNLGNMVNTGFDEEIVGINPDGSELIVYLDHIDEMEDLYISKKKNNGYGKLEKMPKEVNDEKEYSGSIFHSEDGISIFFVRKSKDGYGLTDIYCARKLANGQWCKPFNLGPKINTPYREDFPWVTADGKTLYFSSQGHNSMGGFDLFKSVWNEELQEWSAPINLGFPLNTADDEQQISILPDKRAGYVSAARPEGFGNLDIYRVTFLDEETPTEIVRGHISLEDSTSNDESLMVTAIDEKTQEEMIFKPNTKSGDFIMALHPGKYTIIINSEKYKTVKEELMIFDIGASNYHETNKDYRMMRN